MTSVAPLTRALSRLVANGVDGDDPGRPGDPGTLDDELPHAAAPEDGDDRSGLDPGGVQRRAHTGHGGAPHQGQLLGGQVGLHPTTDIRSTTASSAKVPSPLIDQVRWPLRSSFQWARVATSMIRSQKCVRPRTQCQHEPQAGWNAPMTRSPGDEVPDLATDLEDGAAPLVAEDHRGQAPHALAADGLVGMADAGRIDPDVDLRGPQRTGRQFP